MFEVFRRIKPFARPYFRSFILASLCSLPMSAVTGYQAYYVKQIFDVLLLPNVELNELVFRCGVLLGLQVLQYPFRIYHFYTLNYIAESVTYAIREKLFRHYQRLPLRVLDDRNQGDLLAVALSDTVYFANSIRHVVSAFREPLTAISLLAVAVYHDWFLTMVIFVALPVFAGILSYTGKKIKKHVKAAQDKMGIMFQNITEGVQNHKVIKVFQLQQFAFDKFQESQKTYLNSQSRAISYEEHSHPAIEMIGTFAICFVLVIAHNRIVGGHLTPGSFVSFATALALFMNPIKKFNLANVGINQAKAAISRIFLILDVEEESEGDEEKGSFSESIVFKNVCFSHQDREILKNINLEIKKGEKIAFIGKSGAGKSSLVSILLGLYPINSGDITIDGVSINQLKKSDLRNLFSYVGQDVYLFNDTIRENLSLGATINNSELMSVSDIADLNFVQKIEDGWDSVVGDRGAKLSGGQSQRLTLARALLKKGDILILDEATSALDNKIEAGIKVKLDRFTKEKTVIAVAHRLSTIQDYDRIVVLDEGRIIEDGPHDKLIEENGAYKKLYDLSLKG